MLPFELDPNAVVAGWIPVVLILVLAAASLLLFRSMRNQMRKIDFPEEGVETRPERPRDQEKLKQP